MKKLLLCLVLMLGSVSCVNGNVEVPDQTGQDETGIVNLIEFTF